jgi:hypothetical protein
VQETGHTRRALIAGAAAATAAGVAGAAAGTGLLSSPPQTVAATPSLTNAERLRDPPAGASNPGLSGEVFVSSKGSDHNSGASWDSALATIAKALDVVGYGTVYVGAGTFDGGFTIGRAAVRGAGRDSTFVQATHDTETIVTMTDGALMSDLNVQGTKRFMGTSILITGTLVHVQDVDVKNDDATNPQAGYGGYGVVLRDGEGCLLTRVEPSRQRLAWKVGGANHVFVQMRGDSNYKDILFGGESPSDADTFLESGAHLILGSKFVLGGNTGTPGAPTVRCIEIAGNGQHTLIDCDWDEADNAEWLISSDNNVLTRCAIAPHNTATVGGNFNTVQGLKVLGEVEVNGSDNTLWNTFAASGGRMVVNGARNLVQGENGIQATGSGIRRLAFE